jgi:hypothetical protein
MARILETFSPHSALARSSSFKQHGDLRNGLTHQSGNRTKIALTGFDIVLEAHAGLPGFEDDVPFPVAPCAEEL